MAQERIQNRPDECHKSCKSTVTRPKKAASSAQVSRFRRPEISASFVSVLVPAVNNDKANAPDRFASAPENVTIPDIRQISSKRWTIRPEASQSPQGPLRARFQKGSPASRPACGNSGHWLPRDVAIMTPFVRCRPFRPAGLPRHSFPASSGTTLNRSPTRPMSATWKMGASSSLLMAMMVLESFMPARCWMAPEMPTAT